MKGYDGHILSTDWGWQFEIVCGRGSHVARSRQRLEDDLEGFRVVLLL